MLLQIWEQQQPSRLLLPAEGLWAEGSARALPGAVGWLQADMDPEGCCVHPVWIAIYQGLSFTVLLLLHG